MSLSAMFDRMSVSEAKRHDLYTGLNDLLGPERADTLMAYLPTDTDLVTRTDLADAETRLGTRISTLETRIDGLDSRMGRFEASMDEFNRRLDRFFLTMLTGMFAMVASFIAAVFVM